MIAIDASALVAILLGEPEAGAFASVLEAHEGGIISPTSVFETVAALVRVRSCSVSDARVIVDDLMKEAGISIAPMTAAESEMALTAFDRFGKGRHPASLNMGDCYTYALAKTMQLPLLFKGNDFSQTDLDSAA